MGDGKEPDKTSKVMIVGFAVILILGGAYGLSNNDLGWSAIILGSLILLYYIFPSNLTKQFKRKKLVE